MAESLFKICMKEQIVPSDETLINLMNYNQNIEALIKLYEKKEYGSRIVAFWDIPEKETSHIISSIWKNNIYKKHGYRAYNDIVDVGDFWQLAAYFCSYRIDKLMLVPEKGKDIVNFITQLHIHTSQRDLFIFDYRSGVLHLDSHHPIGFGLMDGKGGNIKTLHFHGTLKMGHDIFNKSPSIPNKVDTINFYDIDVSSESKQIEVTMMIYTLASSTMRGSMSFVYNIHKNQHCILQEIIGDVYGKSACVISHVMQYIENTNKNKPLAYIGSSAPALKTGYVMQEQSFPNISEKNKVLYSSD